jgi:signal transduction histidine kinase
VIIDAVLVILQVHNEVVIAVTDTARGIPPEELAKIWDRLYRGIKAAHSADWDLGAVWANIVQAH